ncbi:hypothetical protein ACI2KR_07015 [Pseudomonas luteola]
MSKEDANLDLDLLLDDESDLDLSHELEGKEDLDDRPASHSDDEDVHFFRSDEAEEDSHDAKSTAVDLDDDDDEDDLPNVDNDLDDENEEAQEQVKKTGPNFFVIGAVAAVAVVAGVGAYVKLFKGDMDEQPVVHTSMPAPSMSELGKDMSIPSTNLTEDKLSQVMDSKAVVAEDDHSKKPEITSVPNTQAEPASQIQVAKPSVEDIAPNSPETTQAEASSSTVQDNQSQQAVSTDVTAPTAIQSADSGSQKVPESLPKQTSTDLAHEDSSVSKDEIHEMVNEALKGGALSNVRDELAKLNEKLDSVSVKPSESPEAYSDYKAKVMAELELEKAEAEKSKAERESLAIAEAIKGKQRVPGFQVVNATKDGSISIIKSPNGRVFALFKGESFHAANGAVLQVKEIISEGKLVVAGDNWFIDETLEPYKPAPRKTQRAAQQVQNSESNVSSKTVSQAPAKQASLSGYSLNASFEGGYLIKTPTGDYVTVSRGASIEGLGTVYGIDDSGNLKTEKGIVKSGF